METSRKQAPANSPDLAMTGEELRSLTHGEFWIPEAERVVYQRALRALNAAGVSSIVAGLYAIYEYTGIYRKTKDLDLFFRPEDVLPAAEALRAEGFGVRLVQPHWLAKAEWDGCTIDLIFGMGNGMHLIDEDWYRYARTGVLAAVPVRVAPPEELIWHRLFVSERHRTDTADILHLLFIRGDELDWERILRRTGDDWRLLLAQVHLYDYVYPGHRARIPTWVRQELLERAFEEMRQREDPSLCRGPLISRFSYAIDVNEWGFEDVRARLVEEALDKPIIQAIRNSHVWDEEPVAQEA
jgi:hypothetical protein